MSIDRQRAEAAIAAFLGALGIEDAELNGTPKRVVDAYEYELLAGYADDPAAIIAAGRSDVTDSGIVVLTGLRAATMCPHHLLPALGSADIAYDPGDCLLGLGTVAQLLRASAARLTLQEAIAPRVVGYLMQLAGARGAFCRLSMRHTCFAARGEHEHTAVVVTTASDGTLASSDGESRLALALGSGGE